MKNAPITDTILHWTEDAVTGTSSARVRAAGDARQPADRVPRAVIVRPRRADHADPRPARRLRRRRRARSRSPRTSRRPGSSTCITPTSAVDHGRPRPRARSATTTTCGSPCRSSASRSWSSARSWPSARRSPEPASAPERGTPCRSTSASEVGKLRRVLVHRPGLEHAPADPGERRGPAVRRRDLGQAGEESSTTRSSRCSSERGVEVFDAEELLTRRRSRSRRARDWIVDQVLDERQSACTSRAAAASGPHGASRARRRRTS